MNPPNDLNKTVFISYRREPSSYLALALFKQLQERGYDVFWDIESIGAGQFEPIILNEIRRRAHFVLLLANRTLDRCAETGDWLRREVEYAMSLGRSVIPVTVDGFSLKENSNYLTGELNKLLNYNTMPLSIHYFDAGIEKLCNQFLTNKNYGEIGEVNDRNEEVKQHIDALSNEPMPSPDQLEAERLLNQGFNKVSQGDASGAIIDFTKAIGLNPNYGVAYSNRGAAKAQLGEFVDSLVDLDKAITINPNDTLSFTNRALTKFMLNDLDEALIDFEIAFELDPNNPYIYLNRFNVYKAMKEFQKALDDQNQVLKFYPLDSNSYFLRSDIHAEMGNLDAALEDLNRGLQIDPYNPRGLNARGTIFLDKGNLADALTDYDNAINVKKEIDDTLARMLYSNRGELNFLMKRFSRAVKDFEAARKHDSKYKYAIVGSIVAYHAQGQVKKAKRMWQELLKLEPRYADMDWLQKELNWANALVAEARKLVTDQSE